MISNLNSAKRKIFFQQVTKSYAQQLSEFETAIKTICNVEHVVALNSGTAAIHLALRLLNVKRGDRVICSTFSFIATVNPVLYLKATPVFVDSELDTLNMDPKLLDYAIKHEIRKGCKPKAIIFVHIYGIPAQLHLLKKVASKYDIPLIEDAAQGFGSMYHDKMVGTIGDFGILSFNNNKILTGLGGGMLVCRNQEAAMFAKYLATQAKDNRNYYHHEVLGYNYRMSPLNASYGLANLFEFEREIESRKILFNQYLEAINNFPGIELISSPEGVQPNRWLNPVLVNNRSSQQIFKFIELGLLSGLDFRYLWKPLHEQPICKKFPRYENGNSQWLFKHGFVLPFITNKRHVNKTLKIVSENFLTNA